MEWKFARSKLFISFFEDGDTLPPPFNLFPTISSCTNLFCCSKKKRRSFSIEVIKNHAIFSRAIALEIITVPCISASSL